MKTHNIKVRKSKERGHANYGWLNTYHTFSFGDYHDPAYMGFRSLRVINDDTIKPGMGFETHRHKDMEILTYVIQGALRHKDSMGHGSVIRAGNFQRMTAGTGVNHSEVNPSPDESTRLLQIWILPDSKDLVPSYEELSLKQIHEGLTLIAAREHQGSALTVHQDVRIYFGRLKEYESIDQPIDPDRGVWLQMIKGKIKLNEDIGLDPGDGAAVEGESRVRITSLVNAEFLLFDLA